eukprot:1858973-Prymnesium_polylepis.1
MPSGMSSGLFQPSEALTPLPTTSRVASLAAAMPTAPSSAPALKSASRSGAEATARLSAVVGCGATTMAAEVEDSSSTSFDRMLPSSSSPQPTCTVANAQTAGENERTYDSSTAWAMRVRDSEPWTRCEWQMRSPRILFWCWIGPPRWSRSCKRCVEWPGPPA